jgi:hypothetical protein
MEQAWQDVWEHQMEQYREELDKWEEEAKQARKAGGEPPGKRPVRPALPRLTVDDITYEALVPALQENPRGLGVLTDELTGWVLRMSQYKGGGQGGDRPFFLTAWSGSTYTADRKQERDKGPVRLRHPFLSVLGGIPPAKLRTLRGDRPGQRAAETDDGFLDRILFSYPKEYPAAAEDWKELAPETVIELEKVFSKLRTLEMVKEDGGKAPRYRPYLVHLTADARRVWQWFTQDHASELNEGDSLDSPDFPDHLKGPWSKMRGYCARLALLIHSLRWACGEVEGDKSDVDAEDVKRAVKLVNYFKGHARKVYSAMGGDSRVAGASKLLDWIKRERRTAFKRWEAQQDLASDHRFPTADSFDKPLELLAAHGYIRAQETAQRTGPGRKPATVFEVNPLLYEVGRENPVNRENTPHNGRARAEGEAPTGNSLDSLDSLDQAGEENDTDRPIYDSPF